jgi:hypothetical protein
LRLAPSKKEELDDGKNPPSVSVVPVSVFMILRSLVDEERDLLSGMSKSDSPPGRRAVFSALFGPLPPEPVRNNVIVKKDRVNEGCQATAKKQKETMLLLFVPEVIVWWCGGGGDMFPGLLKTPVLAETLLLELERLCKPGRADAGEVMARGCGGMPCVETCRLCVSALMLRGDTVTPPAMIVECILPWLLVGVDSCDVEPLE